MSGAEDKIVGLLRKLLGAKLDTVDRNCCPDEETLSQFMAGNLAVDARSGIEGHLADCSFCTETLVGAYNAAQPGATAQAPQWLVARAMALVPAEETLFDLSVRLLQGSLELVRTTGRVVPFPSLVLRGALQAVANNALQVEQEVGRFKIAVEIDVNNTGGCQLVANVAEPSGAPADGVRLTLNAGEREQASFLTRAGVVVFDRIAPGEYSIAVSESGSLVGKIRVNLMLER